MPISNRLEEAKHQLDSLVKLVAATRKRELLYRKAFIIRCQNLQKAENEVIKKFILLNCCQKLSESSRSVLLF